MATKLKILISFEKSCPKPQDLGLPNVACSFIYSVTCIQRPPKGSNKKVFYSRSLKVALQILGQKIYKNTKKSSLYSQSLLFFIHKTPVVESHLSTSEI